MLQLSEESMKKWKYTLITLVFALVVFHPETYKLVNRLASPLRLTIANAAGCPTMNGLLVHLLVFGLLLRGYMEWKK